MPNLKPVPGLPTVAVILANHNYSQWIGNAMRSVDEQDYPNVILVVIDDGSTDNSWDVIKLNCANLALSTPPIVEQSNKLELIGQHNKVYHGYMKNTRVIAYQRPKAGGPSAARNMGIKLAWPFAQIFSMFDADDIMLQGKISKSVAKMLDDPSIIGGVYTDYETFNPATGISLREYKPPFDREGLLKSCMIHSACVVSKAALTKVGLYDESLRVAEDYDLWLRITEHFVIANIPECLMKVRVGSHNSTNTVPSKIWQECWQKVMEKTMQRMQMTNG